MNAIEKVPNLDLKKRNILPGMLVLQSVLQWCFEVFCVLAMPVLAAQMFLNGIVFCASIYFLLSVYFLITFGAGVFASPAMWRAGSLIKSQRYREAEKILAGALGAWKTIPFKKDWTFLTLQSNLALAYMASGQYEKAESLYEEIIERIGKNSAQANHPLAAVYLNNLAMVYLHQAEFEGAEKLARQALKIWSAAKYEEQAGGAYPLATLLEVHLYNGDLEACERDADLCLNLSTSPVQPVYIIPESRIGAYVQSLLYKAIVCLRQQRKDEALSLCATILDGHHSGLYPHFGYSIPGLNTLAQELMAINENEKAERFLEIAYEILKAHPFHGDGPVLLNTFELLLISTQRSDEVADLKSWVRPGKMLLDG